ncbi:hypothetical protein B296_00022702 [Ensete ventricosum]|uniref:Uncharacterized protein n=1 Tax=Ensete ventricosum TaxID=4639 RepID=A0A426Z7N2_ENSVE|nr:hypothetical protein B296_00022702 [Ensete ventricosum]
MQYWAVHTGLPTDRYADSPLSGGTADWGCFRPVTTRNRLVTIDFDRWRSISGGINRGREKEEEGEEKPGSSFARAIRRPRAMNLPTLVHIARYQVLYYTKLNSVCRYGLIRLPLQLCERLPSPMGESSVDCAAISLMPEVSFTIGNKTFELTAEQV